MMKIWQVLVLIIGLAILASAKNISERSEKSTLSGNVFDEYGALIPHTKVTFTDKAGKVFEALTNENGVFQIELNEGRYTIEFYKAYFKPYKIENYKLAFKSKMQIDVALEVRVIEDWIIIVPMDDKRPLDDKKP